MIMHLSAYGFLFLSFVLLLPSPLGAEYNPGWEPEVIRYTSGNGLSASMVFKVIEDSRGYIWLATNNGAVRYDGHTFQTYTTRNGLANNTILNIIEDHQDRIWFVSLSRHLCYFQNGHIYPFTANALLDSLMDLSPKDLYFEKNGTMWIVPVKQEQLFKAWGDTVVRVLSWQDSLQLWGANYWCSRVENRWMTLSTGIADEDSLLSSGHNRYGIRLNRKSSQEDYTCLPLRNGTVVAAHQSRLVAFDSTGKGSNVLALRPGDINTIVEDSQGDLWVLMRYGVLRYRGGIGKTPPFTQPEHYLAGTFITSVLRDRGGNYWFSSWNNGLFCMPGMQFQTIRPSPSSTGNAFATLKVYNDQVWGMTNQGNIFLLQENAPPSLVLDSKKVLAPTPESLDFMRDSKGRIWVGQQLRIATPRTGNTFRTRSLPVSAAKTILPLRNGGTAIGTSNGFFLLRQDTLTFKSSTIPFFERTNALFEDGDGTLWIGTVSGLYRFDGSEITNYGNINPLLQNRVVGIAQRANGDLLLGTQGMGLLVMRDNGKTIYMIDAQAGLASDIATSIYVENNSTIWVGTNRGLSRIALHSDAPLRYTIVTYTIEKGLPSNGISCIIKHHGSIWLATDDGVCRFNPNSATRNELPLPIEITDVAVNGEPTPLQQLGRLPYNSNNITISFIGIGFRTSGDIRYRYRLLGLGADTAWHETANRAIPFFALPAGHYLFQVSAINEDGVWNPVPREVSFRIVPHYTQTLWFKLGLIALGLIALALIVWRIVDNRRRKYAIDSQIRELRQQALSANMNPHFIANALSVVQDYVLRHNAYEANEFLARFSRLIRLNLETSLSSFVVLGQEMERLELYLSLERLRFGDDLEYTIHIDEKIDPDETLVPSMLVQPYVENAIWHGILPAGGPGLVEVEIAAADSITYTITIRDNGVGFSAGKKAGTSDRKSLSMELNRERLNLLSKSLKRTFSITVSDILDSTGKPCGTVVTIVLPRDNALS